MKQCSKCKQVLPPTEFKRNSKLKSGLHSWCKGCCAIAFSAWRKADPIKWAKTQKAWRAKNPGKAVAYHKDAGYAAQRTWNASNRDKKAAYQAARTAQGLRATPPWADPAAIAAVYVQAEQFRALGLDIDVDHVIPLQGKTVCGLHVANNLRVCLASDNRSKGNKLLDSDF
jgi:hypothetical protein